MKIRPQIPADLPRICTLNDAAFAEHGGTAAFDQFRAERDDIVSLVAETDENLVGHVLFSPVILATPSGDIEGMGLGQLAVQPTQQRQGIGSKLTLTGIQQLREAGCPFIIVVGHATYYPRFGFERGSAHGIKSNWANIPDDSFMILVLDQQPHIDLQGTARFDGM